MMQTYENLFCLNYYQNFARAKKVSKQSQLVKKKLGVIVRGNKKICAYICTISDFIIFIGIKNDSK